MCLTTTLKTTLTQCETEMLGPERPSHIVARMTSGPARSRGPSGPTAHAIAAHPAKRFKRDDLKNYLSERAKRGSKLPRGFQKVDKIEVVPG